MATLNKIANITPKDKVVSITESTLNSPVQPSENADREATPRMETISDTTMEIPNVGFTAPKNNLIISESGNTPISARKTPTLDVTLDNYQILHQANMTPMKAGVDILTK